MIQPTYYTTPPLQNLPVTAHGQQFSLTQQIPAWPTAYIPSSTVPLPPAASYPQGSSLPMFHAGNQTVSVPSAYIPPSQLQNSTSPPGYLYSYGSRYCKVSMLILPCYYTGPSFLRYRRSLCRHTDHQQLKE